MLFANKRLLWTVLIVNLFIQIVRSVQSYVQIKCENIPISNASWLFQSVAILLFTSLLLILLIQVLSRIYRRSHKYLMAFCFHFLLGVVFLMLTIAFRVWVGFLGEWHELDPIIFVHAFKELLAKNTVEYSWMFLFAISLFHFQRSLEKSKRKEIERLRMEEQLLSMKLLYFKSQIQPHFLFNSLNSVSFLIEEHPEKAKNMLADIGDLLRSMIHHRTDTLVTIQEEVDFLKKYLDIEKIRFGDLLSYAFRLETGVNKLMLPHLILQPIIENSVKHNPIQSSPLRIEISIYLKGNDLHIDIENNGRPLKEDMQFNLGLSNVQNRLNEMFPGKSTFIIVDSAVGVVNKLSIPMIKHEKEITHEA